MLPFPEASIRLANPWFWITKECGTFLSRLLSNLIRGKLTHRFLSGRRSRLRTIRLPDRVEVTACPRLLHWEIWLLESQYGRMTPSSPLSCKLARKRLLRFSSHSIKLPSIALISRVLTDPSDAADITQDVFIKVFRNIGSFHGDSSLRTWMYRIALREASNQRRWWSRHRGREITIETETNASDEGKSTYLKDLLVDEHASPYELTEHEEIRAKVEIELRRLAGAISNCRHFARFGRPAVRRNC